MAEPVDQVFQQLKSRGSYRGTLVSTQPDGISGWAGGGWFHGGLNLRRTADGTLSGSTTMFLLSDRARQLPGNFATDQPFSTQAPEKVTVTVSRVGTDQFSVTLAFAGGISRTFTFPAHTVGDAIVGATRAIGITEHADEATYVLAVGPFQPDPR